MKRDESRNPETWRRFGSAAVSDALRSAGKPFQTLEAAIKPLDPSMTVAGPAFTVRCYPGATWAVEQAIERARPGDVLVIDGGGMPDVILMGGLMSTRMQQRGIAGAIVDGAVRDVDDIIRLGFPVFSRYVSPRAGTFVEIGEWQTTVCCGRVPVAPNDWSVADRVGAVVVPHVDIEQVFGVAEAIHLREAAMAAHLAQGMTLGEAAKAATEASPETGDA